MTTPDIVERTRALAYERAGGSTSESNYDPELLDVMMSVAAEVTRLRSDLADAQRDAERYRWLRDLECCSLSLTRNDDHSCNYVTAKVWIEDYCPDDFKEDDPSEVERMKATNTIWRLQIYPRTPIGFNVWNASTIDASIDAAIEHTHNITK